MDKLFKKFSYNAFQIGALQTILTLAMFLFELPSGILTDKLGSKLVMLLGHGFIVVYLVLMLLNLGYFSLICGFIFYGVGLSLISGSDQTLLFQIDSEKSYKYKIGLFEFLTIFAQMCSSLVGGYLTTISW
ncbi:MFS transporter [Bombilactobacillus thymidiniphilus]|uniref:MFS transporter n=1 Tax=Bombilactobacillus thymidiniphilus TaxID=2923363 RepID=A0ABY4PEM8_9LACO|nr:MFS transporter [Bombilactobacillus thymidiniphilus]UQS83961.1 MFS transporter [Bombilactobacillus thymidiniphilus]